MQTQAAAENYNNYNGNDLVQIESSIKNLKVSNSQMRNTSQQIG